MYLLLIETTSSAAADDLMDQIATGSLFGVSLGTTTKSSSYSNYILLEATKTRSLSISEAALSEDVDIPRMDMGVVSFTDAGKNEKMWYLRGMLS